MNKKLLVLIVLLLVGGGAYYFMGGKKGMPSIANLPVPGLSSGQMSMGDGAVPKGSIVSELSEDVVIMMSFLPRNIDPAIDFFDNLKAKFKATSLWEKQGLDAMLESMKKGGQRTSILGEVFDVDDEVAEKKAEEIWNATDEIVIAVSKEMVKQSDGTELPKFAMQARFQNDNVAKEASDFIKKEALKGEARVDEGESYLALREGAENTFDFGLHSEADGITLKGSIFAEGNELTAIVAGASFDEFKALNGKAKLVDSESWKKVEPGIVASSGMLVYFASTALTEIIDSTLGVADQPKEVREQMEMMFNQWDEMESVAGSMDFDGGANSTSCMQPKQGSKLASMYGKFVQGRKAHMDSGAPSYYKLVGENTLLGFRLSLDVIPFMLDMIEESYSGALESSPQLKQEAEQFRIIMDKARTITNKFGFYEAGLVVNATPGGMMPEAGIYLGSSRLEGEELLKELAGTYNEFAGQAGPQSIAMVSADEMGPVVNIPMGMAAQLSGRVVGGNSVVLGTSPFFHSSAKRMLDAEESYLAKASAGLADAKNELGAGDFLLYLNTEVAIQMMQPWYPMAAQQVPGATVEEIEEIANLLKTRFVSLQHTKMADDSVVCSKARSFVLD